MTDKLNSIIDSIELKIHNIYATNPVCIFVGIGTFAGMTKIDRNGIPFLDDENYHQFPPVLQQLYNDNKDMQFCCIYIDPALENPVFITQDFYLRQKLFENKMWKHDDDEFCYDNTRITVYPFRHNIKIKNTLREISYDFIDITNCIDRLHKICIENNLLYIYHDFSGNDYCKHIEKYFMETIKDHLDHIIYGFGNGYISGCYYDMRKIDAHFAYIREKNPIRDIIRIFNIINIITKYDRLSNKEKNDIPFINFLNNIIDIFPLANIDIITSQIKLYIDNFISEFKNYILSNLRYFYNIQNDIIAGKDIDFNINFYGLNILGIDITTKICDMIEYRDINMFEKIKKIIGYKYKIELELIMHEKNRMNYIDIMNFITQSTDVYQWNNVFNRMLN